MKGYYVLRIGRFVLTLKYKGNEGFSCCQTSPPHRSPSPFPISTWHALIVFVSLSYWALICTYAYIDVYMNICACVWNTGWHIFCVYLFDSFFFTWSGIIQWLISRLRYRKWISILSLPVPSSWSQYVFGFWLEGLLFIYKLMRCFPSLMNVKSFNVA